MANKDLFQPKNPDEVKTAPLVALGLVGGWLTARETGIRPLGGAVLLASGLWAGRSWHRRGIKTATVLGLTYVGAFGASHPLAKRIGPWPAVLSVTGLASLAAYLANDKA